MEQHLYIVIDAAKSHWDVRQTALIQSSSQALTIPALINSVKIFMNAVTMQNSNNTAHLITCVDTPTYDSSVTKGNVWKGTIQALFRINKAKVPARILVIQKAPELTEQSSALSAMVAAERLKVKIDGVALGECETLAQASGFTGGVFIRQGTPAILQTLFQVFLSPSRPKTNTSVHMRPLCSCCNKQVDKAYVCSSCLALYCQVTSTCRSCQRRLLIS
mmetsp:Transcript_4167/g.6296  ORF Transcript_4167/g.6296 Transcript_4167/m.6296 type:complete len:219 (+) Transcript_4167:16-672(+)